LGPHGDGKQEGGLGVGSGTGGIAEIFQKTVKLFSFCTKILK
jgi:hypothetical protein